MSLSRAVPVPPPTPFSTETLARVAALLVATLWFDVLHDAARHASATSLPHWLAALAGLATQLAFTAAEAALAVHQKGDGWQFHDELSKDDLKKLSDAINALAEPISKVAAVVAKK